MTKHLLALAAIASVSLGAYAEDATLVKTFEAIWTYYDESNEDWEAPDAEGVRTLELYSDGVYKIIHPFGTDAAKDVLKFTIEDDNITFQGLKSSGGVKYIYYSSPSYSYVYDSTAEGGEYSGFGIENGYQSIWYYIAGSAGYGYVYLYWIDDESSAVSVLNADSQSAAKTYYNLQGMRVLDSQLRPGMYIVKNGDKTQKIVVK